MALTIEQRLDAIEAKLAAIDAAPTPPAQTRVICTECLTEIPVEDAENWPDPDQGGATRFRCKSRTACKARVKAAEEQAAEMARQAEERRAALREQLVEEAKARLRQDDADAAARERGEG